MDIFKAILFTKLFEFGMYFCNMTNVALFDTVGVFRIFIEDSFTDVADKTTRFGNDFKRILF